MGDVVNLRQARKQKRRAAASHDADANRLAFGRSKGERQLTEATRELAERRLEAHRRDPDA